MAPDEYGQTARSRVTDERCPCGCGQSYDECCGRLHRGEAEAATAEQLMRSRFSAYVVQDADYLLTSWHPRTRPASVVLGPLVWTSLEIIGGTGGGLFDSTGTVSFRAHYLDHGQPDILSENSLFEKHNGRWVYVEAVA
jgi:SEC-C motif-containing protein